jgi:hypothetical protein
MGNALWLPLAEAFARTLEDEEDSFSAILRSAVAAADTDETGTTSLSPTCRAWTSNSRHNQGSVAG